MTWQNISTFHWCIENFSFVLLLSIIAVFDISSYAVKWLFMEICAYTDTIAISPFILFVKNLVRHYMKCAYREHLLHLSVLRS